MSDIIDLMRKQIKDIESKDPLLKKGIKKNWVCIIHPRFVGALRVEYEKTKNLMPHYLNSFDLNWLDRIMSRRTFIINEAPDMHIEYMTPDEASRKYPEFFKQHAEDFMNYLIDVYPREIIKT